MVMNAWIIHKLLRGFNFFLIGLLILILFGIVKEWFHPEPSQIPNAPLTLEPEASASTASMTEEVVFKEPIFAQAVPQMKSDLSITFRGTASNGSKFFAVVEYEGRQSLIQVGDTVGAWMVQNISERDLILKNEKGETIHVTREFISGQPIAPSKPNETLEESEKIKNSDQNHLQLDEKSFQDILSHWADLLREVQILPYVEKGESKGYVILNIKPNGVVQKLGFRTGDIIEKINDREVTNLASLLVLFEPLTGQEFKIDIKRGPKKVQLVYQISKNRGNI
jgi:general secretion pathway protein C